MGKSIFLVIITGLAAMPAATGQAQPPRPDLRSRCGPGAVFHKANVPRKALAALRSPMADSDQPFQVGDSVPPGRLLPFHRLICAERTPDGYRVHYEYGGFATGTATAHLIRQADGSFVEERPQRR